MSFQQALSGLNASSKALDVTSNNVANSATVGFKSGSAHFADVYAASLSGAGASQIGIGTSIAAIQQSFTQGNITTTNNPLDIAINGGGFYAMEATDGTPTYSRNGQFHLDNLGYIVDDKSRKLRGYQAVEGVVVQGSPKPLQMDASDQTPVATGSSAGLFQGVKAVVNLDSRSTAKTWVAGSALAAGTTANPSTWTANPANYNWSTALSVYDTLGNAHTLTLYAVKTGAEQIATSAAATTAKTATDALVATTGTAVAAKAAVDALVTAATTAAAAAAISATATTLALTNAAKTDADAAAVIADDLVNGAPPSHVDTDLQTAVDKALASAQAAADATSGEWQMHASADGTSDKGVTLTNSIMKFTTGGVLDTTVANNGVMNASINLAGIQSALGGTNSAVTPLAFKVDFTGSSQYGSKFGANSLQQDGYTSGRLTGLNVNSDGVIRGNYSNGQSRDLGQIALANFTNPNGLASMGGNQWVETSASGQAMLGAPGTASLGALQSTAVEESNVDLTVELVNMITEQRNYQANAQSIKAQDQIMQTIVNIR